MPTIETKMQIRTAAGTRLRVPVAMRFDRGRIWFDKAAFALKDEISAMRGAKWHGHEDESTKIWSVEDCARNRFQIDYLTGKPVYEWFDRPLERFTYRHPTMPHQNDMADAELTYHYQIWGAEMGVGKTLAAQCVIELAGVPHWFWIGPKNSLPNIAREFRRWDYDERFGRVEFMTYDALVKWADSWEPGAPVPNGMICDESSRVKTWAANRTRAAQFTADLIRQEYGFAGYVLLMSGTPSPKTPIDWWSQAEIVWPGYLREGSAKALEKRLAFMVNAAYEGGIYKKRVGWRDDEDKCATCGALRELGNHEIEDYGYHPFIPSRNEVAYLYERLKGLVVVKHKKDCLTLPDKRYRVIECEPTGSILRVAKAIVDATPSTMRGLELLRELSDGFQYSDTVDGTTPCKHCEATGRVFDYVADDQATRAEVECPRCKGTAKQPRIVRVTREVPCPKVNALKACLDECEETGRIVIFAGFTGAIDRIVEICGKEGWSVIRIDGRGFHVFADGEVTQPPLDYWADLSNPKIAVVAHPESGGQSLTLTESRMAVFWSNSFKPEYRTQAEDRIHRKGMDENLGCTIVDLFHLPSDRRVMEVIRDNRRLELMTLGELAA